MRASGLLLTVLVVVGGARAQYPGQQGSTEYVTCAQHEECVYWQQCHEGVLNTGGIGNIDIRSPPPIPSSVVNPRLCESFGKLCCINPDKTPIQVTDQCPLHHLCVPTPQCIDGEINTSGIGLIDQRIRTTPCINPEYPNVEAVCCKRPDPVPLVTCQYDYETCRLAHDCDATSGTYELGVGCYVDAAAGVDGVCCSSPVVPQCSSGNVCVTNQQCTAQGLVNTDGSGNIDVRLLDRCDLGGGETGVCCAPPVVSHCKSGNVCVTNQQCTAQGFVNTDGSGNIDVRILDRCDLGGGETGVCCLEPPVEKCSQPNAVCNPPGYCEPNNLSTPNGYTETCYRTEGSGAVGECCLQRPLLTCPDAYTCNLPEQCVEPSDALVGSPSCELKGELVGVCCTKKPDPPQIVDVCPQDSACLPETLCEGNSQTIVTPVTPCRISGTGYTNPGVCCTNVYPGTGTPNVECGVGSPDIDTRIKSSTLLKKQARFAEFPWMGILFFTNHTYKCGASLVDDQWVLTAAHCVAGFTASDFRIRLGEYQVDLYDTLYPYEDYDVASIAIHPDFKANNLHNDVAVLRLSRPVTYRHHINRICLPPPGRVHSEGVDCIATGWGKDAFDGGKFQVILKKVSLPVVPYDLCQELLRKTRLGRFFILDKSFVCAGGKAGQDACTGDGGGPLQCLNPKTGRYELYGMTAWGIGCGIEGNPGVYVNVPYFMEWVYGIMQPTPQQQQQHSAGSYAK